MATTVGTASHTILKSESFYHDNALSIYIDDREAVYYGSIRMTDSIKLKVIRDFIKWCKPDSDPSTEPDEILIKMFGLLATRVRSFRSHRCDLYEGSTLISSDIHISHAGGSSSVKPESFRLVNINELIEAQ